MRESCPSDLSQFGVNVFSDERMRERLEPHIYAALHCTLDEGRELPGEVADDVAEAMLQWALERGATHYTHWFQPMTGSTAEKHDSFLDIPSLNAQPILKFSGKALIKGEADGSSFPSGGLRATFEARGYTAWDCTSPAFVRQDPSGLNVLCIPTAFCSFGGEALDEKTPLLRSMEAINCQALRVLHQLGRTDVKRVIPTVGGEQEYFLIDKQQFARRKDLVYTGRTLFGATPAKGQELEDQYYAATPERVAKYMRELNAQLWKLGVPAKTQHNEVAPSQYELAPVFASSNVACDHNQIVMEQMRRVADRHGFTCLLHEKPFAYVNGSGKHNNWSLSTDAGENLLEAPCKGQDYTVFSTFFLAVVAAVDEYAPALRMSCASISNEQRLGGSEAPPPILSVFTGPKLWETLSALTRGAPERGADQEMMTIGVSTLPALHKDETDRNRTSPFAFTGNKFEFRMVGSSQALGLPNTVLNTIVAERLCRIADALEAAQEKQAALRRLLGDIIERHAKVIYHGNNYAQAWTDEARRRGLPVIENTVDALLVLEDPHVHDVFARHGVFSEAELNARLEVALDNYVTMGCIEGITMLKVASQKLLPASVRYAGELARCGNEVERAGLEPVAQRNMLRRVNEELARFDAAIEELRQTYQDTAALKEENRRACAVAVRDRLQPAMARVRTSADALERMVDKAFWPMPSYGEMLFQVI